MKITHYAKIVIPAMLIAGFAVNAKAQTKDSGKNRENLFLKVDLTHLGYPVEKLFFTYYNTTSKFRYTDSATVGNNKVFQFKTFIDEPILAQLRVIPATGTGGADTKKRSYFTRDNYSLYIEPGKITATAKDSLGNTEVTGSAAHKDFLALKSKATPYEDVLENLYQEYGAARKSNNSSSQQVIENKIDSVENLEKENVYKAFVKANATKSPVALYALSQYAGYSIDPSKAQPLYDLLAQSIKNLPSGISFGKRIEIARHLQIGQPAFPFTQTDTTGKPVSLASFKGKYVLIDFWASWCGPCRAENPNVVKAFNDYKDSDFTVLGVSLDRPGQKEKWLKAIHDDGLTWTHVSDLKFWDNEVAKLYDVKAIPQNFLVDKEGKIIAKDIRGEALQNTLHGLVK